MRRFVALCLMAVALATAPAFADFDRGLEAYDKGDYKTALQEWQPLAEQGNAGAQFYLGVMYEKGYGVLQDYKEAVKWYTLSAKQGHSSPQYNLGLMYNKGQGVPQDYKEAMKWYRLSAEQGNATAQFNLGAQYYYGEGVIKDYAIAHMWYNISASNGSESGEKLRDVIAKLMTSAQIEKAQDLAKKCLAKDYKGC